MKKLSSFDKVSEIEMGQKYKVVKELWCTHSDVRSNTGVKWVTQKPSDAREGSNIAAGEVITITDNTHIGNEDFLVGTDSQGEVEIPVGQFEMLLERGIITKE